MAKYFDYATRQCFFDQKPAIGEYADGSGRYYLCDAHMSATLRKYFYKDNLTRLAEANETNAAPAAGEQLHGNVR